MILPYIRKATINGETIHGFLGKNYGLKVQFLACIATAIGYIFNYGFEIYFSTEIFMNTLGLPELTIFLAIGLAVFSSLYCMIGGFYANARTDLYQNTAGIIAVILLFGFLLYKVIYPGDSGLEYDKSLFFFEVPPVGMLLGLSAFLILFNSIDMANWQMI